jgi:hypothetical protein
MNRTTSCVAVLLLLLIAVAVCIGQTIESRELFSDPTLAVMFAGEGIAAGLLISAAISLLRKRFARQKKPFSHRPVPVTA